jgi:hypothetical protein
MGADAGGSSLVNDAKYAIRKVVQTPLENVATVRMIDIHVRGAPGIGHRLRVRNMTVADTVMIMSIRQRHAAAVGVTARTHITAGGGQLGKRSSRTGRQWAGSCLAAVIGRIR